MGRHRQSRATKGKNQGWCEQEPGPKVTALQLHLKHLTHREPVMQSARPVEYGGI
jgi:hypothetical protein